MKMHDKCVSLLKQFVEELLNDNSRKEEKSQINILSF